VGAPGVEGVAELEVAPPPAAPVSLVDAGGTAVAAVAVEVAVAVALELALGSVEEEVGSVEEEVGAADDDVDAAGVVEVAPD
jgi:hypothetical protein